MSEHLVVPVVEMALNFRVGFEFDYFISGFVVSQEDETGVVSNRLCARRVSYLAVGSYD